MTVLPTYFVPTNDELFSVTFDDGPEPGVTDKVVEALDAVGAKGTFFMVGEAVERNPSLAREVLDAGHAVGIHSHRHRRRMTTWSLAEVEDDFRRAKDALASATGEEPRFARPPFGNVSVPILEACGSLGLLYVGWSVNTRDWLGGSDSSVELCTRGSIVLFHDGGRVTQDRASRTIGILRRVIDGQARQGRRSVAVPALLASWDDGLVTRSEDSGLRMTGWSTATSEDGRTLFVAYWMPEDAIGGMTYGLSSPGGRSSVTIPPMSKIDDWIAPVVAAAREGPELDLGKVFSSRYNGGMGARLNIGCGKHVLDGWVNLDVASRAVPPVGVGEWNQRLPYADGTVDAVLVQHSLQHCRPDDYDRNFSEIARVLRPGGRLVLKEADDRHYVWHRPGVTDRDGYIASSISQPEAVAALTRAGLSVREDKDRIVAEWGVAINRQRRLLRGRNLFVVEGTKAEA
jgi:peptidoglycan/xylan/chitin deacetylase (PgdA/CDA1 family)